MSKQVSKAASGSRPAGSQFKLPRRHPIEKGETATEAVRAAVATAENVDADSLPPLDGKVDTESLDELIASSTQSVAGGLVFTRTEDIVTETEVSFEYAGYEVTVSESYVVLE